MQDSDSLKGLLLAAMPGLADPNFFQTVTCICEHTPEGAVGIIVNRIHETVSGKEIFEALGIAASPGAGTIPVHIGGPVHEDEIFILHGPPLHWEASLMITDTLALSNTRDILEAIGRGRGPELHIIALGCAGWGPGQLETEIGQNTWLTHPFSPEVVFQEPVERRWEAALRRMGIDPALFSGAAGHA